jgi:hypothetical protein
VPTEKPSWSRWSVWMLRVAWIATGVAGSEAVEAAVDGRSDPVRAVALIGAGGGWVLAVAAMAIPSTLSLTVTRVVVPLSVVAAAATALGGAGGSEAAAFAVAAMLSALIALASEVAHIFVQASAYGDEQRFPLRPPLGYLLVAVGAWVLWAPATVAGPLLIAAGQPIFGGLLALVAIAGAVLLFPRWHRLSRRWLVLVPAGMVVHDPLVLGETMMIPRARIAGLRLAQAGTEALDLTGPAAGHAVEISVTEPVTVLIAPTPAHRTGRAVHMRACLASPSRPGRALTAAKARRLPVG